MRRWPWSRLRIAQGQVRAPTLGADVIAVPDGKAGGRAPDPEIGEHVAEGLGHREDHDRYLLVPFEEVERLGAELDRIGRGGPSRNHLADALLVGLIDRCL